jgi:hypothetical protein
MVSLIRWRSDQYFVKFSDHLIVPAYLLSSRFQLVYHLFISRKTIIPIIYNSRKIHCPIRVFHVEFHWKPDIDINFSREIQRGIPSSTNEFTSFFRVREKSLGSL